MALVETTMLQNKAEHHDDPETGDRAPPSTGSSRPAAGFKRAPAWLLLTMFLLLIIAICARTTRFNGGAKGELLADGKGVFSSASKRRSLGSVGAIPLEPEISMEMQSQPAYNKFDRYITFKDYRGNIKRLRVSFRKKSGLTWEGSFPEGFDVLKDMVVRNNRSYWDRMFLENRGGRTSLPIKHLTIIMKYDNPAGTSPHSSNHIVNGIDLSQVDHARIPIVDWDINVTLRSGYHKFSLNYYRTQSLYKWAGVDYGDPAFVRAAVQDMGKSGSDGRDNYGSNPKYGGGDIALLCSEFVSWYYSWYSIQVNGKSLRDITTTQSLHDLFKAEGNLYRYNSGNYLQDFVHCQTGVVYRPKTGDWLERRGPDGAEHSMILLRWLPKDPSSSNPNDRYNQALVINGPSPVTLRLVKIHKDETDSGKDFWLGRID